MRRPLAQPLGAFALAAALATGSTAACAAPPSGEPAFYLATNGTGSLVRIDRDRGLGFIARDEGPDVFVHFSALAPGVFDTLRVGEELEFDIEADPQGRGLRAGNVRLANR